MKVLRFSYKCCEVRSIDPMNIVRVVIVVLVVRIVLAGSIV